MENVEIWKPIVGFEGIYEVSNIGGVRRASGQTKTLTLNRQTGYFFVSLHKMGKQKVTTVHRLVLMAFHGLPKYGQEGCHNDGIRTNNNSSNLRWDSTQNNQLDRVRHGTSNRGERCANSKLTENQVHAIRQDTRLQRIIASEYGVRENTISRIKSRKRWAHLD